MSLVLKSGPRFSADSPSPEQTEGRGGKERGGEGVEKRRGGEVSRREGRR